MARPIKRAVQAVAAPQPRRANPQTRNTVTVASKLPHGLVIRLFRMEEYEEQGAAGQLVRHKRAVEIDGTRVTIHGHNSRLQPGPKMPLSVAFTLTHNVPADVWDGWLAEHRESAMVRNGLIFAASTDTRAADQAKEHRDIRTGFEPIDPDNPGRHQPRVKRFSHQEAA